ncbi:MAG: glycosyltransferase family 39 protein [Pseudomonadota bacterium]
MKTIEEDQRLLVFAWAWVALFTGIRFVYAGTFNLVPDETNYWQWSRYLDLGYHDQAPMIGWLIRIGTLMLGHTEQAVRLPSIIALAVTSIYLVKMAGHWFGNRAALNVALMSQGIFAFNIGGILATADGLQAACWAAACYHVGRGYEDGTWGQWLLGGMWFGLGMLSKYSMALFLPFAFFYGLTSAVHRRRLAGIRPYAGVALGLVMFTPVIAWNARHNWNSMRHVAYIGGASNEMLIHWNFFGDFIAAQAALLTPLAFILVLMAWWQAIRHSRSGGAWTDSYLLWVSLPVVAGFALLSLHTRVYGNWPMAGFVPASVLVAAHFGPGARRWAGRGWRAVWRWALGTAYAMTLIVFVQVLWPVLPVPMDLDRTSQEVSGWRELGQKTGAVVADMPDPGRTFIFGTQYQMASELAFYMPGQPRTLSINRWHRPNVYDYWWKDADRLGWDAVGVTDAPYSHTEHLQEVFERVDPPIALHIYRPAVFGRIGPDDTPARSFYIYRAYGFKGGLRWIPPAGDIRAGN